MPFTLTPADLVLLKRLVNGQPAGGNVSGIRDFDGTGNNVDNPLWGATGTPFLRLTPARYGEVLTDPISGAPVNRDVNPIFAGLDVRTLSNLVGAQTNDTPVAASGVNLMFSAFGQYLDHGLDFLAKGGSGTLQIGAPGTGRTPGSNNPADLTRGTVVGFDAAGVPIHDNQIPVFLDQNQTYGPTERVGVFLRQTDGAGGVTAWLAVGGPDPSAPGFDLLPSLRGLIQAHWANDTRFVDGAFSTTFRTYYAGLVDGNGQIDAAMATRLAQDFMGTGQPLLRDMNPFISVLDHIVAGDGRVNENITLTAVHTVWARNHNFHVENLLASGFSGTVEEVFQAAKLINEVEYQRVVLTDYTDALLGGMRGSGTHGHDDYNPGANPGISHEFAAAAFRFGHSLVTQTVQVVGANGELVDVPLFDAFLNPGSDSQFTMPLEQLARFGYTPQPGYRQIGANSILQGIEAQAAEEVDVKVVDALRNDLVRVSADLFSFNVARGRDLGLGTLNQVRQALQSSTDPYVREAIGWAGTLRPYASWEDFQSRNGLSDALIAALRQAYPDLVLQTPDEIADFVQANPGVQLLGGNTVKGIDRVDLWVGGLAERHINGGVVGQTFWVILHEQFDRLQEADRLYYTDRVDNAAFYDLIDGGTEEGFAAIVRRNTGLQFDQDVFHVGGAVAVALGPIIGTAGSDVLVGTAGDDVIQGLGGDDALSGGVGADQLEGGAGNDTLDGGSGADVMTGGAGDDTYLVDSVDDQVLEEVGGGIDTVLTTLSTYALDTTREHIVFLGTGPFRGTGSAGANAMTGGSGDDVLIGAAGNDTLDGAVGADRLEGGAGNDVLRGGEGADTLDGGVGADSMTGGAGDDLYLVDAAGDIVVELPGEGVDTVRATTASYVLGDGVEHLVRSGTGAFSGTGNALANRLVGGSGVDSLDGRGGDDSISGGGGADRMTGGGGADTFVYAALADSGTSALTRDRIVDFVVGADRIDLGAIDANIRLGGDQAFTWRGTQAITGAGQLNMTYDAASNTTIVRANVDAQLAPDFTLELVGDLTRGAGMLSAVDFVL